jgi:hypothetical protein
MSQQPSLFPLPAPTCACGYPGPFNLGPGTANHYARLECPTCHAFRGWALWPRCPDGTRQPRPAHLEPDDDKGEYD